MKFDVSEYVEDNLNRVQVTGGGEITAECPWCERFGGFYVNPESGNFICFKCEKRGFHLVGLVAQVEGITWSQARQLILKKSVKFRRKETPQTLLEIIRNLRPGSDRESAEEKSQVEAELPEEFIPIYKKGRWKFPVYLTKRGIKRETARRWGLGYCIKGDYADRLIVPIRCPNGRSFTARDMSGFGFPKILNPPGADHGRLLMGWDLMTLGNDLALVEGPFDALKWSQHGIQTLALGGKVLHKKQQKMLFTLPKDTAITIALDPEENDAPYVIGSMLSLRFENVFIARLPDGIDPGDSTKKQGVQAYENAQKFRGRNDRLSAKLRSLRIKTAKIYG